MPAVMLVVFALTLFVSASLLFIVEPMVGKMMLPLLGGTPAVWNTCMLFFQAVLLAGYGFAHASTRWLGPRRVTRALSGWGTKREAALPGWGGGSTPLIWR